MFLNSLPPSVALVAKTAFSSFLADCVSNAHWLEIGLILALGIFGAIVFFLQRAQIYRVLAWGSVFCTAVLSLSIFFRFALGVYVGCGMLLLFMLMYQQELRELAIKFSGARPFSVKHNATVDAQKSAIDAICHAVTDLSRNRVGAIIVVERLFKLDNLARTGVELDAKVTPYLLRNIFHTGAPLHDGAVIIRDGRILSAGSYLPLTARLDLDPDIGSRHRAAIGLSEICDSGVVVVSEETGIVSVAYRSELTRNYNFQTLETLLNETLFCSGEEGTQE